MRNRISTGMVCLSILISAAGLKLLPEPHHVGVIMTSLLVMSLGLTVFTYAKLEAAQVQRSII